MSTVHRLCGTLACVIVVTLILRVPWGIRVAQEGSVPANLARLQHVLEV